MTMTRQPATPSQDSAVAQDDALTVDGVSVRLGGREVLHDVRFSIKPGEFVGLIGSNGAGKTTLLRVILGLLPATAGKVTVNGRQRGERGAGKDGRQRGERGAGKDGRQRGERGAGKDGRQRGERGAGKDSRQRGERGAGKGGAGVGYVPQKIQLDPDMPLRARDLVGLGLDGQRLGIPFPSRARRKLVDEMLRAVDAEHIGNARVGNLSGGEQQRILIAHALISRPSLLLLDEPLANLDIASEQEVVALLGRIAKEQGIAVLISAHEMNPLLPVMDRIVYMAHGRAASGPTDEVVTGERLSQLYGHHVDVIHVHGRVLVVAGRGEGLDIPIEHSGAHADDGA
jgi:zinc/manganese transport system ATP-binding protein